MDALVLVIIGVALFLVLMVVLIGSAARRRSDRESPSLEQSPTGENIPPPVGLIDVSSPTPTAGATPAPPRPREAVAARLARGLTRSRLFFSEKLSSLAGLERLGPSAWDEVEEALIGADVGVETAVRIVSRLRHQKISPDALRDALGRELVSILDRGDRSLGFAAAGPTLWLVTGVNGTGKTTSIAKMTAALQEQGRTVVLAAADTFRAAAIDQLATWGDRLGVHVVRHSPGADPGAVLFDALDLAKARGIDVVIADTAGRIHTKTNLMEELKKIRRVAERHVEEIPEVLLVLDATVGQNGIAQARAFKEAVEVTGIVLTKLDGTARGGVVVAVQEDLEIPVKLIGVGEALEDLEPFDPQAFTQALLSN